MKTFRILSLAAIAFFISVNAFGANKPKKNSTPKAAVSAIDKVAKDFEDYLITGLVPVEDNDHTVSCEERKAKQKKELEEIELGKADAIAKHDRCLEIAASRKFAGSSEKSCDVERREIEKWENRRKSKLPLIECGKTSAPDTTGALWQKCAHGRMQTVASNMRIRQQIAQSIDPEKSAAYTLALDILTWCGDAYDNSFDKLLKKYSLELLENSLRMHSENLDKALDTFSGIRNISQVEIGLYNAAHEIVYLQPEQASRTHTAYVIQSCRLNLSKDGKIVGCPKEILSRREVRCWEEKGLFDEVLLEPDEHGTYWINGSTPSANVVQYCLR